MADATLQAESADSKSMPPELIKEALETGKQLGDILDQVCAIHRSIIHMGVFDILPPDRGMYADHNAGCELLWIMEEMLQKFDSSASSDALDRGIMALSALLAGRA